MFTHLVLMKKSPFYLYCENKEDALSQSEKLGDLLVAIVETDGKSLIVLKPRKIMTLDQEEVKQIECDEDFFEDSKFLNSQEQIDKELGLTNEQSIQPQLPEKTE